MDKLLEAHKEGVVLGLKGVTGVVDRLDIDELLLRKPDTFNLFLLALKELQEDQDTTKLMGYFQIAGIHGLPIAYWNGVKTDQKTMDKRNWRDPSGYCAHSRLTFPTWHRPYLAMMEQSLFVKMMEVAQTFEDSEKYVKAAQEFRLPYWDYYRPRSYETVFPGVTMGKDRNTGELLNLEDTTFTNKDTGKSITMKDVKIETKQNFEDGKAHSVEPFVSTEYPYDFGMPQIFMLERVMMRLPPHDKLKLEHNPLRTFWFPNNDEIPGEQWNLMGMKSDDFSRGHTVRHLLIGYKSPFQGTNIRMNQTLNKARENGVEQILNMVAPAPNDKTYSDYITFATNKKSKGAYGSLEGLHNSYHNLIGGSGHMSRVPIAAFDPIFWMHHANIDRYLAVWQAANPGSWTDPNTGKLKKGLESLTEELKPFFKNEQGGKEYKYKFWTSEDVADTEVLGYKYPDIQRDPEETKRLFEEKYGWSTQLDKELENRTPSPPDDMKPLDLSNAQVFARHPEYLKPVAPAGATTSRIAPREIQMQRKSTNNPRTVVERSNPPKDTASHDGVTAEEPKNKIREWFVDDVVERMALNGSFSIDYFIGPSGGATIPVNPQDYSIEPTLAGSTYIFSAPVEACDNCGLQDEQAHLVTNTTPITPMLIDYMKIGQLRGLEPGDVKPFLVERLRWRVATVNGELKDPRKLPGLKVSVSSKVAIDAEPPVVEEYPDVIEEIIRNASDRAGHLPGTEAK